MTYNKRFPEIWWIITKETDFKNKVIVDVGCGGGDLVKAVFKAQARRVYGFDLDVNNSIFKFNNRVPLNVILCEDDINGWGNEWPDLRNGTNHKGDSRIDILTCFSVLPYLDDPAKIVRKLRSMAHTVLIEMQYRGDGPGQLIKNDEEMFIWLKKQGFNTVENIGKTFVEDRDKYRTIWCCK